MVFFSASNSRDELLLNDDYVDDHSVNDRARVSSGETETPDHGRGRKRVDWSIPEEQEEELRLELHRVLTDANGPSPKSRSKSPTQRLTRPKPVLRRGDVTPNTALDGNLNDGIENLGGKTASAQNAQDRAFRVAEDLSRPSSPANLSKSSSPNRAKKAKRQHSPVPNPKVFVQKSEELESGRVTPEEFYEDYVPKPTEWRTSGLSAFNLARQWRDRHRPSRRSSADDNNFSDRTTPGITTPNGSSPKSCSRRGSTTSLANLIVASTALGAIGGQDMMDRSRHPASVRSERDGLGASTEASNRSRQCLPRSHSSSVIDTLSKLGSSWRTSKEETQIRIEKHLQDVKLRRKYLVKLCRALMEYGAPTHRLEEYMRMSARVLEIEAQFLYIPGCMIVSFDDTRTHTTEMKLIRTNQGVDLGKLHDAHDIYKDVVHDFISVEEASARLDNIIARDNQYNGWIRVLFYGLASASVGPWAFEANPIDLPIAFALGCILGYLQIYWAVRSELYQNVFELVAVIITSFLARALGSVRGGNLFCFSALAQSSIALILPGYTVLCSALELQNRSIIAGSVRLVWAIIYSLFLGFALTIGTAVYGLIDRNATNATTCQRQMESPWFFFFVPLFTVSLTVINKAKYKQMPVMIVIAFAGYMVSYWSAEGFTGNSQISSTFGALAISIMANLYSRIGLRLDGPAGRVWKWFRRAACPPKHRGSFGTRPDTRSLSTVEKQQEYSREDTNFRSYFYQFRRFLSGKQEQKKHPGYEDNGTADEDSQRQRTYPLAAAAMLPAIFVQVPSGLSVAGSLVQGLKTANQITGHKSGSSVVTAQEVTGQRAIDNSISFTVGYSIVQVAIGLTVGLYLGTLVVYPLGKGGKRSKMRSGLFSF